MEDEKLREYVREEFVKQGFISVSQWKNFVDYLQILLKQEVQLAFKDDKLINNWIEQKVKELIDWEKVYPIDIFPEIEDYQLKEINRILQDKMGFPLDRLSAEIGRQLLIGLQNKLNSEGRFFSSQP